MNAHGHTTSLREQLAQRLHAADVARLAMQSDREALFALLADSDGGVANNAAWVLTHMPASANAWFASKRRPLIGLALHATNDTMCRLCLTMLNRIDFSADDISTDFLDFCLFHAASPSSPAGIRSLAFKLAYKQCRHYPELRSELRCLLQNIESPSLSAGTRHAWRAILNLLQGASLNAPSHKSRCSNRRKD